MVHLHCHSHFSFLGGASSPQALTDAALALEQPALALTDTHSVAGIAQFQRACRTDERDISKGWKIRPLVGATLDVDGFPLVLLCATLEGYANLCDLLTLALRDRLNPHLTLNGLRERTGDLICLTGDRSGALATFVRCQQYPQAQKLTEELKQLFPGRLFIELTHHCRPGDGAVMNTLMELAKHNGLHCVAANAVRHARPDRYALYDALTCVRLKLTICDSHRDRPVNAQAYLRSEQEMLDLGFPRAAIAITHDIAGLCDVDLHPGQVTAPEARIPPGYTASGYLRYLCQEALQRKYGGKAIKWQARATMEKELDVISTLELDEFFMVVQEIVLHARKCGIRCSGRGSAANSIVAYLLDITPVEPIEHRLLFERFLHTGRNGMPDIDVDFETHRRDEVITWMDRRYGREHTAMTANINTYRFRMAARDMGKVLGFPLPLIDRLAKVLPHGWATSIADYRHDMAQVLGESPLLNTLIALVEQLQDCPRHLSLHSGGMILSRRPLRYFSPTQESANGVRQVQFDKDSVEALGLIKFDVLGLRTLSVVTKAASLVKECGEELDVDNLPPGDPDTYKLIREGKTMSVFQIESPGQWNLLSRSQPDCFDDLVAQVALFRPGPLQGNMVGPYVDRKHRQRLAGSSKARMERPERMPPAVWEVVESTCGIILFQEQILDIAHKFAGLSLRESDDFRRLMSRFRDPGQMEEMRRLFVDKATARFLDELPGGTGDNAGKLTEELAEFQDVANEIFTSISKFVGYGFCRSHAAAFAMIVYQTAWLKAHYPAAYMAAVLEHKPGFYPMNTVMEEAKHCDVPILPVCILRSDVEYQLEPYSQRRRKEFAIRMPLTQVEGVSREMAAHIFKERSLQAFSSLENAYRRLRLHRDVWDSLARAGAFDVFDERRRVLWQLGRMARTIGPSGGNRPVLEAMEAPDYTPFLRALSPADCAAWDFETLGLTPGPHPVALHRPRLNALNLQTIAQARAQKPGEIIETAGVVIARQRPPTAKGMCFIILEDETARIPTAITPPVYERFRYELRNSALKITGRLEGAGAGQIGDYRSILISDMQPLQHMLGGYAGHPGHMAR